MRTTCLLGSLALISAVAIGPAMAAGGKSHAVLVPGTANKAKTTPTATAPTASPGFQPQQDPLGPPPTATAPTASSGFQPHQDPLGPPPSAMAQPPTATAPTDMTVNRPSTTSGLQTTPTATAGHTWRVVPPPPRSASPRAGAPNAGYRPIDPKPRPDAASPDMSPAED
jgi:hypothetical protein